MLHSYCTQTHESSGTAVRPLMNPPLRDGPGVLGLDSGVVARGREMSVPEANVVPV